LTKVDYGINIAVAQESNMSIIFKSTYFIEITFGGVLVSTGDKMGRVASRVVASSIKRRKL